MYSKLKKKKTKKKTLSYVWVSMVYTGAKAEQNRPRLHSGNIYFNANPNPIKRASLQLRFKTSHSRKKTSADVIPSCAASSLF